MSLLPDTPRDWLELVGLVFTVALVALVGWAVQTWLRLRLDAHRAKKQPSEGLSWESQLAVDTPAPPKRVKSGRSPFAPKREAK